MDANYGCLLEGNGKGDFTYVSQSVSGLSVNGDVKSLVRMQVGKQPSIIIGAFNQSLQFYKIQKK